MNRQWIAAVAAALALCVLPAQLAAQQEQDQQRALEQSLRAVHAELRQAATKLDASALFAFVLDTPTPPIIENGRLEPTRASALAATASGFQALRALAYDYTREQVTPLSPTIALWVAEGTARATLGDGREIAAPFAESIVFVLRDGSWKILHAHRSSPIQR
jgi:hypothetical protein